MKIALVSQEYPPETAKGGIGSQTYVKAHGLAALGHEVHVISRSVERRRTQYRDGDVSVTRICGRHSRLPIYTLTADWLTHSTEVATELALLNHDSPIDVIDFPEWGSEGFVHLVNANEWNRIPVVVHIHGPVVLFAHTIDWPTRDTAEYDVTIAMEGACLRLADAVCSSSACSRAWCVKHYGLDESQIPILHTGVDTALFSPRAVPKEARPTIVFVGRITANKGADVLVDAACRLGQTIPDLRVRLLGRGTSDFISQLKNMSAEAGLPDLLEFPGFIARTELPEWLSSAHVFALPSNYEPGPGLVYLEAMSCGLPAVGCTGAGAGEVVTPEGTGLLVPPRDPAALAAALGRLLADSRWREQMGHQARRYAVEHADSGRCVRRFESFYSAVSEARGRRAGRGTKQEAAS